MLHLCPHWRGCPLRGRGRACRRGNWLNYKEGHLLSIGCNRIGDGVRWCGVLGDGAMGGCGGSDQFWAVPYPLPTVPFPHLPVWCWWCCCVSFLLSLSFPPVLPIRYLLCLLKTLPKGAAGSEARKGSGGEGMPAGRRRGSCALPSWVLWGYWVGTGSSITSSDGGCGTGRGDGCRRMLPCSERPSRVVSSQLWPGCPYDGRWKAGTSPSPLRSSGPSLRRFVSFQCGYGGWGRDGGQGAE